MKKLSFMLVALAGLITAPFALAADTQAPKASNGYYSTQHPKAAVAGAKSTLFPPTDITITNASSNLIYAIVPNSPINDMIYPGNNDHIRNDFMYADTHLVLQDPYRGTFFDGYVCRLAMVTAYGNPGSYRVNVDSEYCY